MQENTQNKAQTETQTQSNQAEPTSATVSLKGRTRLLRYSEQAQFRDHLLRLDRTSRRDRFNGSTSDHFIVTYANRCFSNGAVVIGYVEDGQVLAAAELHERAGDIRPTGEIAFSVERHLQRRGLGRQLFARLVEGARAFGYERLIVTTHPCNEAMKRLARSFNASLSFDHGETVGLIELETVSRSLTPPGADMSSMTRAAAI